MTNLKSTAKRSKQLDYTKEYRIEKLHANPNTLKAYEEQIKKINKNADAKTIERQVFNIVLRDNVYNAIMNDVVTYYEFQLDKSEIESFVPKMKQMNPKASDEAINKMCENMVKKTLIYDDLVKLWDIRTTDEETTRVLQNYYKQTNNPIRDIINNPDQFQAFKQTIQDEKTTSEILRRFTNVKIDLPKKAPNQEPPKEN